MNNIRIQKNQTVLDISLRESGSLESLFDLLKLNQKTDLMITEGDDLLLPPVRRNDIVNYFDSRIGSISKPRIQFATAPAVQTPEPITGIYSNAYSNAYN